MMKKFKNKNEKKNVITLLFTVVFNSDTTKLIFQKFEKGMAAIWF